MKRDPLPADSTAADTATLVRLMAGIAAGQRDSFRELYSCTSVRLMAVARRLVGDRAVAEDVVQETYLRIWRYGRSYKPEHSAPMTWITQILRNRAIDLRAYGRHEEVPLAEEADRGDADDHGYETAPPLMAQSAQDTDPRIALALQRMAGQHRQVLTLAYQHGMSHAEIAQHLGVPLGTAKTWVRRALLALRGSMRGVPPAHHASANDRFPSQGVDE